MSTGPSTRPMGCPAGLKARSEVYSVNPTLPSKLVVSDGVRKPQEVVVRVKVTTSYFKSYCARLAQSVRETANVGASLPES